MKMNAADKVAWLLLIVGGLNWGFVGWLNYNPIDKLFGVDSTGSRVIYAIVGVAALYSLYRMFTMMSGAKKSA